MIDAALIYIGQVVDQYLINHLGLDVSAVVLNNLVDADGSSPAKNQNKIVITLINLEHETAKQFYGGQRRDNGQIDKINPDIYFNLDILISANFDSYDEALKFLTATVYFFQANNSFNRKNSPGLPAGISSLNFEIENSPYAKTHNLWSALGAKYQPSIIYKIRHVCVQSDQVNGFSPEIQGVAVGR